MKPVLRTKANAVSEFARDNKERVLEIMTKDKIPFPAAGFKLFRNASTEQKDVYLAGTTEKGDSLKISAFRFYYRSQCEKSGYTEYSGLQLNAMLKSKYANLSTKKKLPHIKKQ